MSNEIFRQVSIETRHWLKLMINSVNCSMLESTSAYDNVETNNGVSVSTCLEPSIKQLMTETRLSAG